MPIHSLLVLRPRMHRPRALSKFTTNPFLSPVLFLSTNPIPFFVKVLMHIVRRNPPAAARHGRRQPAVPRSGKYARKPLNGLVSVPFEDDLRAVPVRALVLVIPVLHRVRVEV